MDLDQMLRDAEDYAHIPGTEGWNVIKSVRGRAEYMASDEFQTAKGQSRDAGEWKGRLAEVEQLYAHIDMSTVYLLPFYLIERLQIGFDELERAIRAFNNHPSSTDARKNALQRSETLNSLASAAERLLDTLTTAAAFQVASRITTDKVAEVDALVREITKDAADSARLASQINEMANASMEATRRLGLEANATHFARQAVEHSRGSGRWLLATIVTGVAAACWAVYAYVESVRRITENRVSGVQLIQLSIAKLVVFSVLMGIALWCSRMYRTHRHNYVVNKHRQNALSTFETFVSSTQDAQVKNSILTQATASIFAPQHTGYGADDSSGHVPQIIETVRTITGGAE